jgi:hypothetical protein
MALIAERTGYQDRNKYLLTGKLPTLSMGGFWANWVRWEAVCFPVLTHREETSVLPGRGLEIRR